MTRTILIIVCLHVSCAPRRQVRRVLLPQGQLGASLHLIGGRGIGIFIYSEKQNTEDGLHSGDQLTKVTITMVIGGNRALCTY